MENLWKGIVFALFRGIFPKLNGSCAFPQNFDTRKLGRNTVFFEAIFLVFVDHVVDKTIFRLFLFLCKLYSHDDIFNSFSLYLNAFHKQ